jgi:hypothetical protein
MMKDKLSVYGGLYGPAGSSDLDRKSAISGVLGRFLAVPPVYSGAIYGGCFTVVQGVLDFAPASKGNDTGLSSSSYAGANSGYGFTIKAAA